MFAGEPDFRLTTGQSAMDWVPIRCRVQLALELIEYQSLPKNPFQTLKAIGVRGRLISVILSSQFVRVRAGSGFLLCTYLAG